VDLAHLTAPLRIARHPDLLVGIETADDAAVYRLDAERAVISTADYITPVVDDAATFGAVAAANALSDVYAMGGRPLMAINLCGYPEKEVPPAVISAMLAGAAEKCAEAGCPIAGGHTVRDSEVKFGLAVTGLVHPEKILRNVGARPGDRLVLTKPLGTGALVAAHRAGQLPVGSDGYTALIGAMTALNRPGERLHELGARAATDVTGFGLTGHGLEMARASEVSLVVETAAVPQLPDAAALCARGFTCGGTRANAAFTGEHLRIPEDMDEGMIGLLHDPQTSGGLLVAVPGADCDRLVDGVLAAGALCAPVVGEVRARAEGEPYLEFV
jgi:selenide,water dikinase